MITVQKKQNNHYTLITDILRNHLLLGCTKRLFKDIFSLYIDSYDTLHTLTLPSIIPLFETLIQSYHHSAQSKHLIHKQKNVETIAFFPKRKKHGNPRFHDNNVDIHESILKGHLNHNLNDFYIVSFKVRIILTDKIN